MEKREFALALRKEWIFRKRNPLIVLLNIIDEMNFSSNSWFSEEDLDENEILFRRSDIKTKPELSYAQYQTALKNLEKYGFIEISEAKSRHYNFIKIKIILNPFHESISEKIRQENYHDFGFKIP